MVTLVPVCQPCAYGDHSTHDDHEGLGGLDMLDCKVTSDDGREQCMCRATWPRKTAPGIESSDKVFAYAIMSSQGYPVDWELYDEQQDAKDILEQYKRDKTYVPLMYPMKVVEVVTRTSEADDHEE